MTDEPRLTILSTEEENVVIHLRGFDHDKEACALCSQDAHLTDMYKERNEKRREIGELQRAVTKRDDILGMIRTASSLEPRGRF
jgi:hypothetical protein